MTRPFLDIDSFAGGGGASVGIEAALGKPIDIAVNHDAEALAMHRANHPETEHYNRNIWQVDPADVAAIAPIRLAWFSPDCTHHSKAKGSAPIRTPEARSSRDLAWVVVLWAQRAQPQIIMLENVEEFADWGPVLDNGKACPDQRGVTFR
ncbi:MAG: DNA cytosine methyltransferase, partial [Alphaproteobacteria bacterium]|nr:DNA cytosine methyltransferase [Alphaproteobacteria bacterium]